MYKHTFQMAQGTNIAQGIRVYTKKKEKTTLRDFVSDYDVIGVQKTKKTENKNPIHNIPLPPEPDLWCCLFNGSEGRMNICPDKDTLP